MQYYKAGRENFAKTALYLVEGVILRTNIIGRNSLKLHYIV